MAVGTTLTLKHLDGVFVCCLLGCKKFLGVGLQEWFSYRIKNGIRITEVGVYQEATNDTVLSWKEEKTGISMKHMKPLPHT